MKRRVVITGLGLVSAAGVGVQAYWDAVLSGQSAIRFVESQPQAGKHPVLMAGTVRDFQPEAFVAQRKQLKMMSREIQLAVAASKLALEDAAFVPKPEDSFRYGISLGAGVLNTDVDEMSGGVRASLDAQGCFDIKKFGEEGMRSLFPLWFLKYLPNMPACHVAMAHGFRGSSNTVTTSSAAAAQAIGEALRVIRRGDADVMLAGGTDSKINAVGASRFQLLGLLSRRRELAQKAYCPFDRRHDGILLGEGAGLVVLEEKEHALKRGARIYGEILGYGDASDYNYDPRDAQDYEGKRLAMKRALEQGSVDPADIDFILANGSGIPRDDDQEAMAIGMLYEKGFGKLAVTGVKPITGHSVYASGGIEIAAGLLAMRDGIVPALANFETPSSHCHLPIVKESASRPDARMFLFNSSGFGGQNASLVVSR